MMAQAGVNPAEAGVVAERFSAQARFLETTVIQQLQEKKAIEFLHGQLMATRALVNSLEQHHDLQSQQIEANLQKALAVYEQAIALRHQQNLMNHFVEIGCNLFRYHQLHQNHQNLHYHQNLLRLHFE